VETPLAFAHPRPRLLDMEASRLDTGIRRHTGDPLETLGRRYATGELSAEECEERRRLLEGSRQR